MSRERLLDLLADRASGSLDPADREDLQRWLSEHPDLDHEMDLAAAALHLAMTGAAEEPMPAHVRAALEAEARAFTRGASSESPAAPASISDRRRETADSGRFAGWLVAAAAVILAAVGWWRAAMLPVEPPRPSAPPALARWEAFSPPDLEKLPLQGTEDPAATEASGELAWSDARDAGFMRIRGLQPNAPDEYQYQLWIFDAERDERFPVDGGVFDVPAGGEDVVIPIDAKLEVENATLFAVTVEKPGGVVVSSRERIVLVAKPTA